MGRRIEVELTSARDDGIWTWRAAGLTLVERWATWDRDPLDPTVLPVYAVSVHRRSA